MIVLDLRCRGGICVRCCAVQTYRTICFLDSNLLVMNLRVRMVTGWSALEGVAMITNVNYRLLVQGDRR